MRETWSRLGTDVTHYYEKKFPEADQLQAHMGLNLATHCIILQLELVFCELELVLS